MLGQRHELLQAPAALHVPWLLSPSGERGPRNGVETGVGEEEAQEEGSGGKQAGEVGQTF